MAENGSPFPGASPRLLGRLAGAGRGAVFLVDIRGALPSPRKTVSEAKKKTAENSLPFAGARWPFLPASRGGRQRTGMGLGNRLAFGWGHRRRRAHRRVRCGTVER